MIEWVEAASRGAAVSAISSARRVTKAGSVLRQGPERTETHLSVIFFPKSSWCALEYFCPTQLLHLQSREREWSRRELHFH